MKVYRIAITPERAPNVVRVFEFSARHALGDIHRAIQTEFALTGDHPHAFGEHWDAPPAYAERLNGREYTPRTRLYALGLEPGRRFAHVLDATYEILHGLEVREVIESDAPPSEPRLISSVGDAPPHYTGETAFGSLVPLVNELVALFPREAEDESSEDEVDGELDEPVEQTALDLEPEALRAAGALALKMAAELAGDGDRFFALADVTQTQLLDLLADLPVALARAEMVDLGAELALALAFIDPAHFLGDRAVLLAEAGRREEALAQVAENIASLPGDAWVEVKAAEVYAALDEPEPAEALLRSALQHAPNDDARGSALDRLLDLLSSQERDAECAALLATERARLDTTIRVRPEAVQRLAPKVGRNDPCPCGSGKKHKRCCLD